MRSKRVNYRNEYEIEFGNSKCSYIVRRQHIALRRKFVEQMLEESLPVGSIVLLIIMMTLLGLASISLQIAAVVHKAAFYYVASGIW
jgi:hypothetical protein